MKNFFLAFALAVLVVLSGVSIRRSFGIGTTPAPIPPMAIGTTPAPIPPMAIGTTPAPIPPMAIGTTPAPIPPM